MNRIYTLAGLILIIASVSFAQDDDSTYDTGRYHRPKIKVGGAGGFTPAWALFNFDEINKALTTAGVPVFSKQPMYLSGGEGYGYIMFLRNVRIGGSGVTGTMTSTAYDPVTNIKKDVNYHVSYGGVLIDYVVPLGDRVDLALGLTVGGGSIDISMSTDDGKYSQWGQLWNEFGNNDSTINVTRHLNGSFFTLQPRASVEYALLRWFQLRVGISYPYMSAASWKLEDDKEILGVPNNLETNGPVITAGIMFGFFN